MSKKEKKVKAKKETSLYMFECISIHKIRYCIETDEKGLKEITEQTEGWDSGAFNDMTEFSQDHAGEKVIAIQPIPDKDTYLSIFDKDNNYLRTWSAEKKMEFINKKFKK